jgi:hypothetical protein
MKKLDLDNFHICFKCDKRGKNQPDYTFKDLHLFDKKSNEYIGFLESIREKLLFFSIDKFTVQLNEKGQTCIRKRKQKKGAQK